MRSEEGDQPWMKHTLSATKDVYMVLENIGMVEKDESYKGTHEHM